MIANEYRNPANKNFPEMHFDEKKNKGALELLWKF
jgi:hypothetical protein